MKLEDVQVKVGVGVGQVVSVLGTIAGYGVAVSGAISMMVDVLPKTAVTAAILGTGTLIGSASNWLLVHARSTTIKSKVDYAVAALYRLGEEVEKETGIDLPIIDKPVAPPTI